LVFSFLWGFLFNFFLFIFLKKDEHF
jgi:hypothetical protein